MDFDAFPSVFSWISGASGFRATRFVGHEGCFCCVGLGYAAAMGAGDWQMALGLLQDMALQRSHASEG